MKDLVVYLSSFFSYQWMFPVSTIYQFLPNQCHDSRNIFFISLVNSPNLLVNGLNKHKLIIEFLALHLLIPVFPWDEDGQKISQPTCQVMMWRLLCPDRVNSLWSGLRCVSNWHLQCMRMNIDGHHGPFHRLFGLTLVRNIFFADKTDPVLERNFSSKRTFWKH